MTALSRSVAVVIVLIIITINIISYCCCFSCCQLVLSMIVHAMKSHPCILNEDVQAMLLCGGKDGHHWSTVDMSVMFKRLPLSLSLRLSFWLIVQVSMALKEKETEGQTRQSLQKHFIHRLPGNLQLLPRHQPRERVR